MHVSHLRSSPWSLPLHNVPMAALQSAHCFSPFYSAQDRPDVTLRLLDLRRNTTAGTITVPGGAIAAGFVPSTMLTTVQVAVLNSRNQVNVRNMPLFHLDVVACHILSHDVCDHLSSLVITCYHLSPTSLRHSHILYCFDLPSVSVLVSRHPYVITPHPRRPTQPQPTRHPCKHPGRVSNRHYAGLWR
jgi:hypothetical protein